MDEDFLKNFMNSGPVEPSADLRTAATGVFELYRAFLDAGFNEDQAMALTRDILTSRI